MRIPAAPFTLALLVPLAACSAKEMEHALGSLNSAVASVAAPPTTAAVAGDGAVSEASAKATGIRIGQTVAGEVSSTTETDEYTLEGEKGQEIVIYFQRAAVPHFQMLILSIVGPMDQQIAGRVDCCGTGGPFEMAGSEKFTLPETATYAVRIHGSNSAAGKYRFRIEEVNRAPETASKEIALGRVIDGEAIDRIQDIDEFAFQGTKGQRVAIHFGRMGPDDGGMNWMWFALVDPSGKELARGNKGTRGKPFDESLREVTLLESGTYTFRIYPGEPKLIGPYRFQIRPLP